MTLLSQLQNASGGSRELDCEIARLLGWSYEKWGDDRKPWWRRPDDLGWIRASDRRAGFTSQYPEKRWTTNLNDAASLIADGCHWSVEVYADEASARISVPFEDQGQRYISSDHTFRSTAATPCLAICLAWVKAHEARSEAA